MKMSKEFKCKLQEQGTQSLITAKISDIISEFCMKLPGNTAVTNIRISFFESDPQNTVTIIPCAYYITIANGMVITKPIHAYLDHADNSFSGYVEIEYKYNNNGWLKNIWGKMTSIFEGMVNNDTRSFA